MTDATAAARVRAAITGPGWALHQGHVLDVLAALPERSVQVVCCSPPYWNLRAYGTEPQVWGGREDCAHDWQPCGGRPMTGGTGAASAKQVTNRGSQFGNESVKTGALAGEVGATIAVDESGELAARRDAEVDVERPAPLVTPHCQPVTSQTVDNSICEGGAASGECRPPSLVHMPIAVEHSAQEVPDKGLRDSGPLSGQTLAGLQSQLPELSDQGLAPDVPAVGDGAALSALFVNGRRRRQEVAHKLRTTSVQAHETDGTVVAGVAISEHQSQPVGKVCAEGIQPLPLDSVTGLGSGEIGSMGTTGTADGTERAQPGSITMPTGTHDDSTAPLACDSDAGVPSTTLACDGAMLADTDLAGKDAERRTADSTVDNDTHTPMICENCGAIKCELGSEPTVGQYIANLVAVFRGVWRVLRDDGTLWCNLGSSYAGSGKGPTGHNGIQNADQRQGFIDQRSADPGYKPKDLVLTPFLLAEALRQDGWYLRSAITLCKVAPMPESVKDRPTNATEMLFLLSKAPTYFYDSDAVRLPPSPLNWNESGSRRAGQGLRHKAPGFGDGEHRGLWDRPRSEIADTGANLRNWLEWRPQPSSLEHYAAYPTFLPKLAIEAGSSAHGACAACGAPWRRVVELREATRRWGDGATQAARNVATGRPGGTGCTIPPVRAGEAAARETIGWAPSCACDCPDVVPQTILDPFGGSGTTGLVATRLGRRAVLIELNSSYCAIAEKRLRSDAPLIDAINDTGGNEHSQPSLFGVDDDVNSVKAV